MIKINADRIYTTNDSLYGIIFRSPMSGLNVAFCSNDKNKLVNYSGAKSPELVKTSSS